MNREGDEATDIDQHDQRRDKTVPQSDEENPQYGHERSASQVTSGYMALGQTAEEAFADDRLVPAIRLSFFE